MEMQPIYVADFVYLDECIKNLILVQYVSHCLLRSMTTMRIQMRVTF